VESIIILLCSSTTRLPAVCAYYLETRCVTVQTNFFLVPSDQRNKCRIVRKEVWRMRTTAVQRCDMSSTQVSLTNYDYAILCFAWRSKLLKNGSNGMRLNQEAISTSYIMHINTRTGALSRIYKTTHLFSVQIPTYFYIFI